MNKADAKREIISFFALEHSRRSSVGFSSSMGGYEVSVCM